jgi:methylthioribulose-1-phosphate dehydratase
MTLPSFENVQHQIVRAGALFDARGWVPATGGNISARLDDGTVAITVSGKHKGHLVQGDIMRVDMEGRSLDGKKPSAETLLHTGLYKINPDVNAILHAHPRASVVYSLVFNDVPSVRLSGYELLKIYPGVKTHETSVTLRIFNNSQDMPGLQREIDTWYAAHPETPPVYLVRGHGLTAGAKDMDQARYVTEATEEMLAYELAKARIAVIPTP